MRQKISYGFRFIKVICLLVLDFMIKKKKKDIYYLYPIILNQLI